MTDHLRISASALLEQTVLADLGKINVICGRNNSGKTTLLNAIASHNEQSVGIALTENDATRFAQWFSSGTIFGQVSNNTVVLSAGGLSIQDMAKQLFLSRQYWFLGQYEEFAVAFQELWKRRRQTQQYALDTRRLQNSYQALFPKPQARVLIPPKRNVELVAQIAYPIKVEPHGTGLLNALFHYKNQDPDSPERQLYDEILNKFVEITGGYTFDIITGRPTLQSVLRFANPWGKTANAEECGLGMQDLLLILYFSLQRESSFLLIEEPESHLHPEMQRKLLQFFYDTAGKQFFLTTHSSIFLDGAYIDRVFFTTYSSKVIVRDETNRALILSDLGYQVTDNLVSDLIILVEGPTDVQILETFLQKMGILNKFAIKFWPLGGDIMAQLDLSVFKEAYNIIALIDADPKSRTIREKFIEKCESSQIPVHRLTRYAIENYFSLNALKSIFKGQISNAVTKLEPNRSIEKQLGFSVKSQSRRIAREMDMEDIRDTDLYEFLMQVETLASSTGMRT